jgi:hypothetical protein
MAEALAYEQIDELVDTDPLALRDYAWRITRDHARLTAALIEITESDPVDMALDPQWSARIARAALAPDA